MAVGEWGTLKTQGRLAWWYKLMPALEGRGGSDFKAGLVFIVNLRSARVT